MIRISRTYRLCLSIACFTAALGLDCWCQQASTWISHGPYGGDISGRVVAATRGGGILYAPAGSLLKSSDGGVTWTSLLPPYINCVACDATGKVLFASSNDRLYKSLDGGQTWTNTPIGGFPVRCIAIQSNDPNTVYLGAYGATPPLRKTTDGGAHWESIGQDLPNQYIDDIALDPVSPSVLYVCVGGSPGGAFRSQDGGQSWDHLESIDQAKRIYVNPKKHKVLFLTGTYDGSILRSNDAGITWTKVSPSSFDFMLEAFAMSETKPKVLYAGLIGGDVYRSKDSGRTWLKVGNTGTTVIFQLLASPVNGNWVYAADGQEVRASPNQGQMWAPTSLSARSLTCVSSSPFLDSLLLAGGIGGLFKSTDGGNTWSLAGLGDQGVTAIALSQESARTMYAATSIGGVFRSEDGGSTWQAINAGLPSDFRGETLAVSSVRPEILYAGGRGGLFRSEDGGDTWQKLPIDQLSPYFPTEISSVFVDPSDPNIIYASVAMVGIARSIDGGLSWVLTGLRGGQTILAFAADASRPGLVVASGPGVFKSTDSGQTWTATGLADLCVDSLLLDPDSPEEIYAGTYAPSTLDHGAVYVSEDGGITWTALGAGMPTYCSVHGLSISSGSSKTLHVAAGGNGYEGEQGWEFFLLLPP